MKLNTDLDLDPHYRFFMLSQNTENIAWAYCLCVGECMHQAYHITLPVSSRHPSESWNIYQSGNYLSFDKYRYGLWSLKPKMKNLFFNALALHYVHSWACPMHSKESEKYYHLLKQEGYNFLCVLFCHTWNRSRDGLQEKLKLAPLKRTRAAFFFLLFIQ